MSSSNEWNALSKEIEEIQQEWKKIGFASKKENQRIYDRFRAACDTFFARKREFYTDYKDNMNANLEPVRRWRRCAPMPFGWQRVSTASTTAICGLKVQWQSAMVISTVLST